MKLKLMAVALSTCSLAACNEKRIAVAIPTPAERLVCEPAGERPKLPREYVIDWTKVTTVSQALGEYKKYVATVRTREGIVAGYIMQIEGQLFTCYNNVQWRREFERELAKPS